MTSALLSLDGGRLAAQLRIDTLVPVKGMKRCADFDMLYGEGWWDTSMRFRQLCTTFSDVATD